jgi:ribonuclease P protein component
LCYAPHTKSLVAVVASKKVSKKAVVRNKNKRRVRHALKSLIPKHFLGYFVFFIKKDVSFIKYNLLAEDLKNLVSKVVL